MKKSFLFALFAFCLLPSAFCQIKIINSTCQKKIGETGGITMNYFIEFKTKKSTEIRIDSVKGIADELNIEYTSIKNDKGYYIISFSQDLKKPEKCPTCRDVGKKQSNLTKGVIVYYKKIDRKSSSHKTASFKVKNFNELPDATNP
jgi:hypothetical protein